MGNIVPDSSLERAWVDQLVPGEYNRFIGKDAGMKILLGTSAPSYPIEIWDVQAAVYPSLEWEEIGAEVDSRGGYIYYYAGLVMGDTPMLIRYKQAGDSSRTTYGPLYLVSGELMEGYDAKEGLVLSPFLTEEEKAEERYQLYFPRGPLRRYHP